MDAREFLSLVLPWNADLNGYASIHWHLPKKGVREGVPFSGRFFIDREHAVAFLEELRDAKLDVYYGTVLYKEPGKRTAENALAAACIRMDIDVADDIPPHPDDPRGTYPAHVATLHSILRFCRAVSIPNPTLIVASGSGGLHVYWCSDTYLLIADWLPYAEGLKAAARGWDGWLPGIKPDLGVIADAARVLRVPGFANQKHDPPRPVVVLPRWSTKARYNFAEDKGFKALKGMKSLGPVPKAFEGIDPAKEQLGKGIVASQIGLLPFEPIRAGCGFLREAHETGGKEYDQPKWNLTTLCAVFLEDGNGLAHAFGNAHPEYSFESTEELWERKNREHDDKGVGWPSCQAISDCGSGACQSCPHFADGKSPLHLALDSVKVKERQSDQAYEQLLKDHGLKPPPFEGLAKEYYAVDQREYIGQLQWIGGVKDGGFKFQELFLCRLSNFIARKDGNHKGVSFDFSADKDSSENAFVRMFEFDPKTLLEKNVLCRSKPPKAVDGIVQFGQSLIEILHQMQASRDLTTLGWRFEEGERTGYVYGSAMFGVDGSVTASGLSTSDNVMRWYHPVGRKEPWFRAAKLLTDRKKVELDILIITAFAAPLMTFAGTIYGGVLSIWGPAGTSKSTAQMVGCTVWAHPKQGRESVTSTPKSVLNKLGMIKNLPAFWDDVQDETRQEHLFQTMFVNTEGMEGSRLDTNIVQRERKEWHTLMVACSNASFVEYVIKKQPSTDAGIRRIFEIYFEKDPDEIEVGLVDEFDATKAFAELEHNYGRVGYEYAQILATKHKEIEAFVDQVVKRFKARVKGTMKENYWWGICGVLIAGAYLARQLGVEVDPVRIEEFLIEQFHKNRTLNTQEGTEGGSEKNTVIATVQYLKDRSVRHTIRTDVFVTRGGNQKITVLNPQQIQQFGRGEMQVHIAENDRRVRISKRDFRKWMHEQNIQPRQVIDGLAKYYKAKVVDHKCTLACGTHWSVGQEDVIEFEINNDQPFAELLLCNQELKSEA